MAFNGLMANPTKTSFVILNSKVKDKVNQVPIKIKIGEITISQENSAKLLGITFNETQNWKTQIQGTEGVITSLNRRIYLVL